MWNALTTPFTAMANAFGFTNEQHDDDETTVQMEEPIFETNKGQSTLKELKNLIREDADRSTAAIQDLKELIELTVSFNAHRTKVDESLRMLYSDVRN